MTNTNTFEFYQVHSALPQGETLTKTIKDLAYFTDNTPTPDRIMPTSRVLTHRGCFYYKLALSSSFFDPHHKFFLKTQGIWFNLIDPMESGIGHIKVLTHLDFLSYLSIAKNNIKLIGLKLPFLNYIKDERNLKLLGKSFGSAQLANLSDSEIYNLVKKDFTERLDRVITFTQSKPDGIFYITKETFSISK
jgi:hypothetical protein